MYSKKVLRYYCNHCKKGFWKKPDALEHEAKCYYNTKNRCCGTCEYFSWYCDKYDKILVLSFSQLEETDDKKDYKKFANNDCNGWSKKGI